MENEKSVARMILQAVEDFATIVKGEIDIAKNSLTKTLSRLFSGELSTRLIHFLI
jgi:hypothetical protein